MSNTIETVISDKKLAGKFTREVITVNIDLFLKFSKVQEAFDYFKENFKQVDISYDNFWYHFKKAKEDMFVTTEKFVNTETK